MVEKFFFQLHVISGNHTPGSWFNSLVGQTYQASGLTLTSWIPEHTLIASTISYFS